ncbi:amidohydrolase [Larsenimonas rhizosphaerae]|uniref:Omega-amidase YafV n=1 Tax=Larsenimonas rhizosphaerae TaxID=2944682 RepID=A0AA41ZF84_9GAMM|nr:amidohydrolase [Larsenimonas rhizosphaerae]MCM2130827.1 amidohydrolase [Larsenimonas rhizosphaerae]MCX2523531.1 amidohydrolase [Larsenimonas rhizosphaerae]
MSQLNVTLVQPDLHWEDPAANRASLGKLLSSVETTDIVVLPEMFATGFTMNSREMAEPMAESTTVSWMQDQARRLGAVITGSVAIEDDGECFNRMIWATPEGELVWYDKRHLFRMAGEHERYGMGRAPVIVERNGFRIMLSVCYDLRFPVWLRNNPVHYDLLLCVANWPAVRRHAWRTLLQARAIENLSYVVGVNRVGDDAKGQAYSGDSLAIDFKGELLLDPPQHQAFVESITFRRDELEAFRAGFPAWQDADTFSM